MFETILTRQGGFGAYKWSNIDLPDIPVSVSLKKNITFDQEDSEKVRNTFFELLEDSSDVLYQHYSVDAPSAIFYSQLNGDVVYKVKLGADYINIAVLGDNKEKVEECLNTLKQPFEEFEEGSTDDSQVSLKYSYMNSRGGVEVLSSRIHCPSWEEIEQNYIGKGQSKLSSLHNRIDLEEGQLMIWHGKPGTGKTYSLTSFIRAHQEQFVPVYITDVTAFMQKISYYYQLVHEISFNEDKEVLFILEDSAEYLLEETRKMDGGGMSQILNLTDGLLSQGRKDLFLVTFNEDIGSVDPAVLRPGRCNAKVEFEEFHRQQANSWLEEKGVDFTLEKRKEYFTLAELYSIAHGGEGKEISNSFEFSKDKAGF